MSEPNRTTFRALVVLEDALRRLEDTGPLKPPEHGVRLALAYLYSITLSKNRDSFDGFWRTATGRTDHKPEFRSTWARTQFAGICNEIGVAQTIVLCAALAREVSPRTASGRPVPSS